MSTTDWLFALFVVVLAGLAFLAFGGGRSHRTRCVASIAFVAWEVGGILSLLAFKYWT